jgi:hypothetical protein
MKMGLGVASPCCSKKKHKIMLCLVVKIYIFGNLLSNMIHSLFGKKNYSLGKFATGHRYFVSFAETHCSIVSLPEHTALLKMESLAHFLQNWSSQIKVSNFLFLAL